MIHVECLTRVRAGVKLSTPVSKIVDFNVFLPLYLCLFFSTSLYLCLSPFLSLYLSVSLFLCVCLSLFFCSSIFNYLPPFFSPFTFMCLFLFLSLSLSLSFCHCLPFYASVSTFFPFLLSFSICLSVSICLSLNCRTHLLLLLCLPSNAPALKRRSSPTARQTH